MGFDNHVLFGSLDVYLDEVYLFRDDVYPGVRAEVVDQMLYRGRVRLDRDYPARSMFQEEEDRLAASRA